MARIVDIGGEQFVVGFAWRTIDANNRKGIRLLAAELQAKYGVTLLSPEKVAVGVGLLSDYSRAMRRTPSAAALLARSHHKNLIVVERVGRQYWYCSVKDYQVLPGSDVLGDAESIGERLKLDLAYAADGVESTFAGNAFFELSGKAPDVESVSSLFDRAYIKSARIQPIATVTISPISALAITVTIGAIAWSATHQSNDAVKLERARQATALQAYRSAVMNASTGYSPSGLMRTCLAKASDVPVSIYGWDLRQVVCQNGDASFVWANSGGDDATLRAALPHDEVKILLDGTGARIDRKFAAPSSRITRPDISLVPFSALRQKLITYLYDARSVGMVLQVSMEKNVSEPGAGLAGQSLHEVQWSVSGKAISLAPDYVRTLDEGDSVASSVSLAIKNNSIRWSEEGHYVVQ